MRSKIRFIWKLLRISVSDFLEYKVLRMSAALAYYTVFSMAPMLIVIISLCDIFYGRAAIEGTIYRQLNSFVGEAAALQIQQLIRNATVSNDITWASAIGIGALIFAATSVFAEIQDSINHIWRLKVKTKKSWLKLLLNRVLSFSMVVSIGFILLVSLIVSALLDTLSDRLIKLFPGGALDIAYFINMLLTFATISFLFAVIFKVLPDAKIRWRDVSVGAITTAVLFMLGKYGISFYLGKSHISSSYGAAGSVVIILLWVYYSAIILYFGAAFTRVYAELTGRQIYPSEYAVWVKQVEMVNTEALPEQLDNSA